MGAAALVEAPLLERRDRRMAVAQLGVALRSSFLRPGDWQYILYRSERSLSLKLSFQSELNRRCEG